MLGTRTDVRPLAAAGTAVTGTNGSVSYLGPFYNDHFSAMRIGLEVESESGTTPALAWAVEFQSPSDLGWQALLDHAGAQVAGVAFAAAATGLRYIDLVMASALPGPDTDGVLVYGTNFKIYEVIIPFALRLVLTQTNGGGTSTKVINAFVEGYVG
jgi:hypothetical protein